MKRREFLKSSSLFAAHLIGSSFILTPALMKRAQAETGLPLESLRSLLSDQALLLLPTDPQFAKYQPAFNMRTTLTPQLRVLCRTAQAVSQTLHWAQQNNIPFALRGGGHSYEGFSQSTSVVIDARAMMSIQLSSDGKSVAVGAGATLGDVYDALAPHGLMIPAGTCPPVGVSGHTQGGGYGLSSRLMGLACDSVSAFEVVNASGQILNVSATENTDLFWALRGGGGGSFGVLTKITYRTHALKTVSTVAVTWKLPIDQAAKVVLAWQQWAPNAPDAITTFLRISYRDDGRILLHCAGQSADTEDALKDELNKWIHTEDISAINTDTKSFTEAVDYFAGGPCPPVYMKAKSDYVFKPMTEEGITTLMKSLTAVGGGIDAIFDAYGGAIGRIASDATAFSHRQALYSIQYYAEWEQSHGSATRIANMTTVYEAMRPYVSGGAYVNYCDLDLKDWADAYWSENLPRLVSIKQQLDPKNLFAHAQSIPLKIVSKN